MSNPSPLPIRFAALALLAAACADAAPSSPRHLILITVDTWRADHFLEQRAGAPLTPGLAAFADQSLVFTRAHSAGNCTTPGTVGVLSGLWPHRSGVFANTHVLGANLPTIATSLKEAGFRTAAFVSNPVLTKGFGFDRGFDLYRRLDPEPGESKVRAEAVLRAGVDWLATAADDERRFLWVHMMEPHGPYDPSEALLDVFAPAAFDGPAELPLLPRGDHSGSGGIPYYQYRTQEEPSADARDYLARYAGEVREADEALGAFLERLRELELFESSVVVLTSDHGEALVDDDGYYFSHGNGLTDDQLRVPLVLHHPQIAQGKRVERAVATIDIYPTVLDLLGVARPDTLDGVNLVDGAARPLFSRSPTEFALREGDWLLTLEIGSQAELRWTGSGVPPDNSTQVRERLERTLSELIAQPALGPTVSAKRSGPPPL